MIAPAHEETENIKPMDELADVVSKEFWENIKNEEPEVNIKLAEPVLSKEYLKFREENP